MNENIPWLNQRTLLGTVFLLAAAEALFARHSLRGAIAWAVFASIAFTREGWLRYRVRRESNALAERLSKFHGEEDTALSERKP